MADDAKTGLDWEADELDIIVAEYFVMLSAELSGLAYTKSRHNAAVTAQIGRSKGSVEFKHQNISAVLDQLGMPWVPGYKSRKNYQSAIFDAIDRYLTLHPAFLEPAPRKAERPLIADDIFVRPPSLNTIDEPMPTRLRRLVRKFDPVERDHRNRSLGKAGESFVAELERRTLIKFGRDDLAKKVRWVAAEDGDGAGYDVLSFTGVGRERLIEVKTTNGAAHTPFFLTNNECDLALERPDDWCIYRVHFFATGPRVFAIAPPLEAAVRLTTETWRASF